MQVGDDGRDRRLFNPKREQKAGRPSSTPFHFEQKSQSDQPQRLLCPLVEPLQRVLVPEERHPVQHERSGHAGAEPAPEVPRTMGFDVRLEHRDKAGWLAGGLRLDDSLDRVDRVLNRTQNKGHKDRHGGTRPVCEPAGESVCKV